MTPSGNMIWVNIDSGNGLLPDGTKLGDHLDLRGLFY